jgi:hypothetical protein
MESQLLEMRTVSTKVSRSSLLTFILLDPSYPPVDKPDLTAEFSDEDPGTSALDLLCGTNVLLRGYSDG